jgi:hypothetical protein
MMTVYSIVERASGRGRRGGREGVVEVGGDGVGGTRVFAMAEGVVVVVGGVVLEEGRRRRRETVANVTGARGGNSVVDGIDSWEGGEGEGGGRVLIGGAEAKRTVFEVVWGAGGEEAGAVEGGMDHLRKAL